MRQPGKPAAAHKKRITKMPRWNLCEKHCSNKITARDVTAAARGDANDGRVFGPLAGDLSPEIKSDARFMGSD